MNLTDLAQTNRLAGMNGRTCPRNDWLSLDRVGRCDSADSRSAVSTRGLSPQGTAGDHTCQRPTLRQQNAGPEPPNARPEPGGAGSEASSESARRLLLSRSI